MRFVIVKDEDFIKKLMSLEIQKDEKVCVPILLEYPKDGFPESPKKKDAVIKWI